MNVPAALLFCHACMWFACGVAVEAVVAVLTLNQPIYWATVFGPLALFAAAVGLFVSHRISRRPERK